MLFDQWSEDAYKMLEWWYKLFVSLVAHPERLVVGNGEVDQLYAKAWPLAVAITIAFLLAASSFMIVAFGRGTEYIAKGMKVAVVVFACSMAAREISPFLLQRVGEAAAAIIGDTSALPFPHLGKGFGAWVGHGIALVVVIVMTAMVISLAPMIVVTAGFIVLSFALRVFGDVGEKQWQLFFSAFLTSHAIGVLAFAAFIRLALNTKGAVGSEVLAAMLIIVIFVLAIVIVGASFYLFYVVASHVSGGRLRADSHNEGGEIDRVGTTGGDRTEPQVHQGETRWQNYDQAPRESSAPPEGVVPPPNVSLSGRTASSSGLEIGLRPTDVQPSGAPNPAGSNAPPGSSGHGAGGGVTIQSGQNLHYPVEVTSNRDPRRQYETDTPQWREESPVPPPLPHPNSERTEEISVAVPYPVPSEPSAPDSGSGDRSYEPPPLPSGVEYIEEARRELGLEDYSYTPAPQQPQHPESEVRNEPQADIESRLD